MKKRLLILILISTLNCFAQNAISPRIGSEIDKYEREYFGLFPAIMGFHFASTTLAQDSSLQVKITRKIDGNLTDTSYQISKEIVSNLAKYIENFEYFRRGDRMLVWKLFKGQAAENESLFSRENIASNFEIELINNEKLETTILFANDSLLVICKNFNGFNWKNAEKDLRFIYFSDIHKLTVIRKSYFWPGVGYGALIGGVGSFAAFSASSIEIRYVVPISLIGALLGAELGGSIGQIMNINKDDEINNNETLLDGIFGPLTNNDIEYVIKGNEISYLKLLPDLKRRAIYSAFPPPEVLKLMK